MRLQSITQLLSGVPTDWIVIVCVAILFVCFSMLRGTTVATALAISLPAAATLFSLAANTALLGPAIKQLGSGIPAAVLFLIIEAILLILCIRIVMVFGESHSMLAGLVAGISATVVLVCIWMTVPSLATIWHFSAKTQAIFGSAYSLWWLIVAYIGVAFARS